MASEHSEHCYSIAWICATPIELVAARFMLDTEHNPDIPPPHESDKNMYVFGSLSGHDIVIVCVSERYDGSNLFSSAIMGMLGRVPTVEVGIIVGLGGGIPSNSNDIRLGDIVVSSAQGVRPAILLYDRSNPKLSTSKQLTDLSLPPTSLLNATRQLRAQDMIKGSKINEIFQSILEQNPRLKEGFSRPGPETDILFSIYQRHKGPTGDCSGCIGADSYIERRVRTSEEPKLHFGTIVTSNTPLENVFVRENLGHKTGAMCFETQAAAVVPKLPCLIVCGISNYNDAHANETWEGYSALMAAAYAKELLAVVPGMSRRMSPEQDAGTWTLV